MGSSSESELNRQRKRKRASMDQRKSWRAREDWQTPGRQKLQRIWHNQYGQ